MWNGEGSDGEENKRSNYGTCRLVGIEYRVEIEGHGDVGHDEKGRRGKGRRREDVTVRRDSWGSPLDLC